MRPELFRECVARLMRHVDVGRIALTGGVAIGLHTDGVGCTPSRTLAAEDIDFVAADVGAVRPTVSNEFLISHFHVPQPGYPKFMIQLADPVTTLRVDVFPDSLGALRRAALTDVDGVPLRIVAVDDLLAHKLALLSKASVTNPVEEKHHADARRLAARSGRPVPSVPHAQRTTAAFSQDLDEVCLRCQHSLSSEFPLASKRAIFDVLGYV